LGGANGNELARTAACRPRTRVGKRDRSCPDTHMGRSAKSRPPASQRRLSVSSVSGRGKPMQTAGSICRFPSRRTDHHDYRPPALSKGKRTIMGECARSLRVRGQSSSMVASTDIRARVATLNVSVFPRAANNMIIASVGGLFHFNVSSCGAPLPRLPRLFIVQSFTPKGSAIMGKSGKPVNCSEDFRSARYSVIRQADARRSRRASRAVCGMSAPRFCARSLPRHSPRAIGVSALAHRCLLGFKSSSAKKGRSDARSMQCQSRYAECRLHCSVYPATGEHERGLGGDRAQENRAARPASFYVRSIGCKRDAAKCSRPPPWVHGAKAR